MLLSAVVLLTVGSVAAVSFVATKQLREEERRQELRRQAVSMATVLTRRARASSVGEDPYPTAVHAADIESLSDARFFFTGDIALFETPDLNAIPLRTDPCEQPSADGLQRLPVQWGGETIPDGLEPRDAAEVSWKASCDTFTGYASPVVHDGSIVGHAVIARRESELTPDARPIAVQALLLLIGTLLAVWAVAAVLSRRITRPLAMLAAATRDIARGRYHANVLADIPPGDEIGELAGAFREMAVRLREVDSRDRRFLMSVSHELRTPLTAIAGHAQALEDGLADDATSRARSLAVIQREAGRLDRLVEDIIDLARLRSNRFNTVTETVWLDELGDHLMAIFHDRPEHSNVVVLGTFEHVSFHSDGHRILQILRNLINNALRYAQSEVVVTGERQRGHIRIEVRNDGEPIPADMQERIFEPFVGSKREGGMGLGLAISRELAWALGGNLEYLDEPHHAVFELHLPLEPPGSGR